jgi:serine/threonine protein kinase
MGRTLTVAGRFNLAREASESKFEAIYETALTRFCAVLSACRQGMAESSATNPTPKSAFCECLLTSTLVSEADLQTARAEVELRAAGAPGDADAETDPDRLLADRLVEKGLINGWQAEQLLRGRAKFNLGPYLIIESIGQGGMGQVFKAEHTLMGRVVAVKVLPRHRTTPESIACFTREIRHQAQLDHENLVRAYDAGQDGNVHFLVTEYVPGTDLRRLVRRNGRLSVQAAAAVITQAARGLEHAHSKGLIHRDIKPGNLLVTPDGRTKVSDLGLATFLDAEQSAPRKPGKTVGTADYLSPEQIISPGNVTPASDIYSLGCTLYYAVTGKVPFPGGTTRDKALAHCQRRPLDPRRINPELSDEFVDVIAAMMAKDVRQRITTAAEVVTLLAPFAGESCRVTAQELAAAAIAGGHFPAAPAGLSDTQPVHLSPQPDGEEGLSQSSDATHPVSAAGEETLPIPELEPVPDQHAEPSLTQPMVVLILVASAAVFVTVTAMIAALL